jgi:hypothetical protein
MEQLLRAGRFAPRATRDVGHGVTGAEHWTVRFPEIGRDVDLKWKTAPAGDADGWNNSPRRELAAYRVQQWFLSPREYVVPTTVARCLPLETVRRVHPDAEPNLPGTRCVLGVLSVWLRNVETPEVLFEPDRFERDPAYARHLADFNLLNYLIENGDMRGSNILASTDPSNRRVFSVDNGISFGEPIFNVFVPGWKELRVPALPRSAVARLRRLERDDADALAVVAEFHLGEDGVLREARPRAPLDPDRGSRFRDGVLQLGLTQHETEALWRRVESLLAVVREERIPVF